MSDEVPEWQQYLTPGHREEDRLMGWVDAVLYGVFVLLLVLVVGVVLVGVLWAAV